MDGPKAATGGLLCVGSGANEVGRDPTDLGVSTAEVRSMTQVQAPHDLIGASREVQEIRALVRAVGRRSSHVLISGERGTGKQLVARHLHAAGPRAQGPFVPVDCTALRDDLLEHQLFGHVRGVGPDARRRSLGFIRAADGGTLFLDNIDTLVPAIQGRLLRCIQNRAVVPIGSVRPTPVAVRIIGATSCDLGPMVRSGRFRAELQSSLSALHIRMTPLRDRPEDVLPLARHFLSSLSEFYGEPPKTLEPGAAGALMAYCWPGNVAEMAAVFDGLFAQCAGRQIELTDMPDEVRLATRRQPEPPDTALGRSDGATPVATHNGDFILRPLIVPRIDCRHLQRLVRNAARRRAGNGRWYKH